MSYLMFIKEKDGRTNINKLRKNDGGKTLMSRSKKEFLNRIFEGEIK